MKLFNNSIIISTMLLSSLAYGQIVLPENKSMLKKQEIKRELLEITGYARYNSTIIGYAISCGLPKEDNKIIYNNYFKSLESYNLTEEEKIQIGSNFDETLKIAKEKGPSNSSLTCETFKMEFDKIVNHIKNIK